MEFKTLEELQKYNQEQFEKLGVKKITTYKTEEEISNYWERINFNSRPHDVFKYDWQHYYSLDFADTLLSYADRIKAKGLFAFDGAELFLNSQKSDRKLYLLDDNQYLINLITYIYPKGVKAEESKKYVQVGKDEVLTFMEINQENKIDIHFKFGERFAKHIDDYVKENKLSFSARSIESTIYKTDKETVEKNFKDSFVHYDMMKFVLETTGVKLTWYNEPQITKAYFAKQVVKKQRIKHKVATGDLYPKIAGKYGTTVEKIVEMNKLKKNKIGKYPIKIGQVLDIDSSRPEDTNLEYEPITYAKLGESIYIVFETKNMQDKMINIKVKQGKNKGIAEKDQAIEMFLHDDFKSDLDMTIGKGAKSSKYKNKDQFLDFAYGKVVLIPNEGSTEKNDSKKEEDKVILKKWNDILNKLQTKSTFLYLYAESKDDAKVFYDGSKKDEFLMVKASKEEKVKENVDDKNTCGIQYRNSIVCTKFHKNYGPLHYGNIPLKDFRNWESVKILKEEKEIVLAMSENEGNLDAVQSYDSEIITVGAMQKTINKDGYGELSIQFWEFKQQYPEKFTSLLENCGWTIKEEEEKNKKGEVIKLKYRAYYKNKTGKELKDTIRLGFHESKFKSKVNCIPMEPIINLCKNEFFQAKQIEDFIKRLNIAISKKPNGYNNKIKDFVKSKLGKATVLDHDVNRPGHVSKCFGEALDNFFQTHSKISKNPTEWKENFTEYEYGILEIYGSLRGRDENVDRKTGKRIYDMTNGKSRYENLKIKLK